MAKLKNDEIAKIDLLAFLENNSDFAFEIQVLNALLEKGFECDHGGSYTDRATKKQRQFDIRATKVFDKKFLRLAVECKNLRANFPLLVSCVPRRADEAFYEISASVDPDKCPLETPPDIYSRAMLRSSKNFRLTGKRSLYKEGDAVGKSCDQVGRTSGNGEIIASDSEVFEKWSQALNSADDLTYLACSDGNDRTGSAAFSLVFPILVVPNGRLWRTEYDSIGKRLKDPENTDRCSYFVNRSYYHRAAFSGDQLTISHLEIVTPKGLLTFIDEISGDDKKVDQSFQPKYIADLIIKSFKAR